MAATAAAAFAAAEATAAAAAARARATEQRGSPSTAERIRVAQAARLRGSAGVGMTPVAAPAGGGTVAVGAATEAAELETQEAADIAALAELQNRAAAVAMAPVVPVAPAAPRLAEVPASPARVAQPTPSAALRRPANSPVPPAAPALGVAFPGARAFTAAHQDRLAESPMRTQNSASRTTAELTSLHIRYTNGLRVGLPAGVTRPAEVADLGPSAAA